MPQVEHKISNTRTDLKKTGDELPRNFQNTGLLYRPDMGQVLEQDQLRTGRSDIFARLPAVEGHAGHAGFRAKGDFSMQETENEHTVLERWGEPKDQKGGIFRQPTPFEDELAEERRNPAQARSDETTVQRVQQEVPKVTGFEGEKTEAILAALDTVRQRDSQPMTAEELKKYREDFAADANRVNSGKGAFDEVIKRFDQFLPDSVEVQKEIRDVQDILKSGKNPLNGEALDEATRLALHQRLVSTYDALSTQVSLRIAYAKFLDNTGSSESAEKVLLKAKELSDKFDQATLKRQVQLMDTDMQTFLDPNAREALKQWSLHLTGEGNESGVIKLPLMSRKALVQLYLGAQPVISEALEPGDREAGKIMTVRYGFGNVFRPDKGHAMILETVEKTREIVGYDPLDPDNAGRDVTLASLYGGLNEILRRPEEFNLKNVVMSSSLETLRKQVKQSYGGESMIIDGVAGAVGLLVMARFGKPGALSMLSKAPSLVKPAAAAMGITSGASVRHVAYPTITGQEESLTESAVHTLGGMGLIAIGSKALGKGDIFTGAKGNPVAGLFSKVDASATAQVLTKHGLETTGKVSDFLLRRGLAREAKHLAALPEELLISDAKAVEALQAAGLHGRKVAGLTEEMIRFGIKSTGSRSPLTFLKEHFSPVAFDPSSASLKTFVRADGATKFYGALGALGVYRSTATAYDYTDRVNPETRKPYTYLEAVREVNFPSVQGNQPWWQKAISSNWQGTVGEALMASMTLGAKGLVPSAPKLGIRGTLRQLTPNRLMDRFEATSMIANSPTLSNIATATRISMVPAVLTTLRDSESRERFNRLIELSQKPITDVEMTRYGQ